MVNLSSRSQPAGRARHHPGRGRGEPRRGQAQPHPADDQPCAGPAARAVRRPAVRAPRPHPSPTPLARSLREPLAAALHSLGGVPGGRTGVDPAQTAATFTVAMRDPMELVVLPALARQLAATPQVELRAVQVRRRTIETALADGALDAAIDMALPFSDRIRRHKVVIADDFVVVGGRPSAPAPQADARGLPRAASPDGDLTPHAVRRSRTWRWASSASIAACGCAAAAMPRRSASSPRAISC